MSLDEFLDATETRIPTVAEMISLCDTLKIGFRMANGQPMLRAGANDNEAEAFALSRLFRREPFRTMVIQEKLSGEETKAEETLAEDATEPVDVPKDAVIMIADESGFYPDDKRFAKAHMWTWIGAPRWYYVRDFPLPSGKRN